MSGSSATARTIRIEVNGSQETHAAEPRQHLVDFLREACGLTGSHLGCEQGACGACTVRLDGQIVRGCLVLAVQADGRRVETAETREPSLALQLLRQAFVARNALQCGYCTSGMLMAAQELVELHPDASRDQIRLWMSGNYCRCTGYHAIVDAVQQAMAELRRHRSESARPDAAAGARS